MADITDSIEELTASLQELTAQGAEAHGVEMVIQNFSEKQLTLSSEVQSFLKKNQEYAIRTQDVSVGSY